MSYAPCVGRRAPLLLLLLGVSACGTFISTDFFGGDDDDSPKPAPPPVLEAGSGSSGVVTTGDGSVPTIEQDAGTDAESPPPPPPPPPPMPDASTSTPLLVFITAVSVDGQFPTGDPLTVADGQCAKEASLAGLTGVFKAWLAVNDGVSANLPWKRIQQSPGRVYQNMSGQRIADSLDSVAKGAGLLAPINISANGVSWPMTTQVWTGLQFNSTKNMAEVSTDCAHWSANKVSLSAGIGVACANCGAQWYGAAIGECSVSRHLYCVQQP